MKRLWSAGVQIEDRISKRSVGIYEYDAPTAEALSRWENDGGAPDRRGESGYRRVSNAPLPIPAVRSTENAAEHNQEGSKVSPKH